MSTFRKLLWGLLLAGLSLNPVYATVSASLNDVTVSQGAHPAIEQSVAREHEHCHSQSLKHRPSAPACCKLGQCDCHQAAAVTVGAPPISLSYSVATVAGPILTGPPLLSAVRFFRPPIA